MAYKNSSKEFDDEKKFLRLENSPPPLTFLVVRPLLCVLPSLHLNTSKSFLDIKHGKEFL